MAGNADYSQLTWDQLKEFYPDVWNQYSGLYGPGSPGYTDPGAGTGTLSGGVDYGGGAYPGKPVVPDPRTITSQVTDANLANMGKFQDLASQTNAFNQAQALLPYTGTDPNFLANRSIESGNVNQQLQGQVPLDVWRQIQQGAAERGVRMGSPGSPNANAAMLAALGTNSIAMQNLGRTGQHQLYADTPVGKQLDPSSLFTNANDLYSAQLLASIYASQANPELQAQELIRLQQQAQRNALNTGSPAANSRNQGLSPVVGGPPLGATPEDLYGGLHTRSNPAVTGTFNLGSNYSTPLSAGPAGTRVGAGPNNSWYTTGAQSVNGAPRSYMGSLENDPSGWFNQNWNQPSTNPWEAGISGGAGNTFETGGWKPSSTSNFFEPTSPLGPYSMPDLYSGGDDTFLNNLWSEEGWF